MPKPELIVVLDTNALHGDVHAQHQALSTLFDGCDSGLLGDVVVWTPRGVVEELVRQYGERLTRMQKVLGIIKRDLGSFGLPIPSVPDPSDAEIAQYRAQLEARLTGAYRSIAGNPVKSERIVTWAAQRRKPITAAGGTQPNKNEPDPAFDKKPKTLPLFGVVDAAIWLTVIEAIAAGKRVAFITSNSADFADKADKSKPSLAFATDIQDAGLNPAKLEIFPSAAAFNDRYIKPLHVAQQRAEEFLANEGKLEALRAEVSDAVEWVSVSDSGWDFGVEIDEVTLAAFEPTKIELIRADPAPDKGLFMTLRASGEGRFDLVIHKGEAVHLPESSPVSVYDWDWNDSMVAANAEVPVGLTVEARVTKPDAHGNEDLLVSIDDIGPARTGA
jgi:hypothetical protein